MPFGPFLIRHSDVVLCEAVKAGKKQTATNLPPHV